MTADAALSVPASDNRFAAGLRGFGVLGLLAVLIIVAGGTLLMIPVAAVLVLLWAWLSKTPLRDLGLVRPKNWLLGLAIGVVAGVALKLLMKAVVMPLLGAPPVNGAFHYLSHSPYDALDFAAYAIYGAGFSEELVFRGYLFERFKKLIGSGALATFVALVVITALFGAAHWQQGLSGVINAMITGFILGATFLALGRRLYIPMVAHASFDLAALGMIYFDLETKISHLVFK